MKKYILTAVNVKSNQCNEMKNNKKILNIHSSKFNQSTDRGTKFG